MFTWKVEEMKLMNGNKIMDRVYTCENEVSREDKIAFVDSMHEGKLSYLLELIDKFNENKWRMPKDSWGHVKTVSLKAWINRNDKKYGRPLIDNFYAHGRYRLLGTERYITVDYEREERTPQYDTYLDLVDEMFHRQLKKCQIEEEKYFREHDEYCILKDKFRNKKYGTTFGVNVGSCSNGEIFVYEESNHNLRRKITIDELKYLLSKYNELDRLVEKITSETDIKY